MRTDRSDHSIKRSYHSLRVKMDTKLKGLKTRHSETEVSP